MNTAPPRLPGMPPANSAPVRPARCARRAMRLRSAPASAVSVLSSPTRTSSTSEVHTTAPRTPSSETRIFEPLPSSSIGTPCARSTSSAPISSLRVLGRMKRSAGPPMEKVVWRRIGSLIRMSISGAVSRRASAQPLILFSMIFFLPFKDIFEKQYALSVAHTDTIHSK